MKFSTYQEYVDAAKQHFSTKEDLKVPIEYLILNQELFELFNGHIHFASGKQCCGQQCEKCKGE